MRAGAEVYQHLQRIIKRKYGIGSINVGDEGGFAPTHVADGDEALGLIQEAIRAAGH